MASVNEFTIAEPKSAWGQDPMCQTFFITGVPAVLTAVDLFFYAKDSVLPMFVEIRSVVNSVPSQTVAPHSRVTVFPSSVSTSEDGGTATTINFDGLVYLEPGEYAIVLNSNSSRYRVWISQLGEVDIGTNAPITKQPYVGVLYKSQNASTWIPSSNQDLKFRLYKAKFNTTNPGTINFKIKAESYENSSLIYDPLQAYPNSKTLKVYHPNHGFTTGSYTKLSGFNSIILNEGSYSNIFGVNVATINNVEFAVSNIKQNSYTITLPATSNVTSISRDGKSYLSASKDLRFDAVYPQNVMLEFGNTNVKKYGKFTSLGYTLDSNFTELNRDNITELDTAKVIPSTVNITNNLSGANPFNFKLEISSENENLSPLVDMKLQSVVLTHNQVNSPTYNSENLNDDIITIASRNNIFFTKSSNTVGLISIPTVVDRANALLVTKGSTITVSNSSVNSGTFRVLDVLDSGANIKVYGNIITAAASNVITVTNGTAFIAEEAALYGSSLSKYITRQIDFANPCTSFNLRLDVCQPANSTVKIYYKVKEVGDTYPLKDEEFVEITNLNITTSLSGEFYEIEKQINNLQPFNAIMFKIVLNSTDTADIPKCKNLRIISLA